jgi:sugar phosphate isomerase/epimerase
MRTMRVGVFTALLAPFDLKTVLTKLKSLDISTVELGTGNYPGDPHIQLDLLDNKSKLKEFKQIIADHGVTISALSCHGEPLHPDPEVRKKNQEVQRKSILLAEKLGVPVVIDFSGCPAGGPKERTPNWVTSPWPPHYQEILDWQWNKEAFPFWTKRAKFAADHGVKIAIEMHPGFLVYSPETMMRLRETCGPAIGCNYDPSHMFWQNIDPIQAISVLGDAIYHVHAKDTEMYPVNMPRTGVLDMKLYTDTRGRSWNFRTVGYGHGPAWWRTFISTLRIYGYDYVLSIEHEDLQMSPDEGLTKAARLLNEIIIRDQPGAAWWVDNKSE